MVVGSRNLQESAREYCPWLCRSHGIPFVDGEEGVKVFCSIQKKDCFTEKSGIKKETRPES
jgi:hypothetical protein